MSSFTPAIGVVVLAAMGMAGWQATHDDPSPGIPPVAASIPSEPGFAVALPGFVALPAHIVQEAATEPLTVPPDLGRWGEPCGPQLRAVPAPAAMIEIDIADACRPGATLTLEHGGLAVTLRSDALGRVQLALPALADPARITVRFAPDETRSATLDIPDLQDYHRVAVTWHGQAALSLTAVEPDPRAYGDRRVHPDAPGAVAQARLGQGGFLTVLGMVAGGAHAQVYTFPRDPVSAFDVVRLSLEARGCAREVEVTTLQAHPDAAPSPRAVTVVLPDCAASDTPMGDGEPLQIPLRDLRVAAL